MTQTTEPVQRDAVSVEIPDTVQHFIGGEFVDSRSAATLPNVEPATGAPLCSIAAADAPDIGAAVDAAVHAYHQGWRRTAAGERAAVLNRIADRIDADSERLAALESRDTGKPIELARTVDIPRASRNFRFFAGAVQHVSESCHPMDDAALNYTLRGPLGVAGLISPWNLPLYLLTWKIAPALAAGNTCVAKPSEWTPLTAHALAEIARDEGLPAGVLNIVHGEGAKAGAALTGHPRVPLISFTGGTTTGRAVALAGAPYFKKLSLELGGKNPNIVFADCDFDTALDVSVRSSFANQGQICLCGSRIFVEKPLFDRFTEALVERARALRIGDPQLASTQMGSLISAQHRDKVESYAKLAETEGGSVVTGGRRPTGLDEHLQNGFFFEPTIVTGLDTSCRLMQEEVFGPVVTITPFDRDDQVVHMANGVAFGLSATVWTSDLQRAHRVAAGLEAGTVWVNTWLFRDLRVPFGGMKDSGIGREGGVDSMHFFTEAKNVCIKY